MKQATYKIQPIQAEHNEEMYQIILSIAKEFNAMGEGYGPSDPEVTEMNAHYKDKNSSQYYVATVNGKVIGGAGIAPYNNRTDICEIRKLYLLPESRGLGLGRALTQTCLDYAKRKAYRQCYLESLTNMDSALALYKKMGFITLAKALEGSVHSACNVWMIKDLN